MATAGSRQYVDGPPEGGSQFRALERPEHVFMDADDMTQRAGAVVTGLFQRARSRLPGEGVPVRSESSI